MKLIVYLKNNLNEKGDFLKEWKRLSDLDKDNLREYATQEMNALGIEIDS